VTHPFVDADVIVRLLVGDDPVKQDAAGRLFDRVDRGELVLATPATTIADCVYVLTSRRLYAMPRAEVAELLAALVERSGLRIPNRAVVLRALRIFGVTNVDFGDAMIAASMESARSRVVMSYDRHFDRLPGIDRQEP